MRPQYLLRVFDRVAASIPWLNFTSTAQESQIDILLC